MAGTGNGRVLGRSAHRRCVKVGRVDAVIRRWSGGDAAGAIRDLDDRQIRPERRRSEARIVVRRPDAVHAARDTPGKLSRESSGRRCQCA